MNDENIDDSWNDGNDGLDMASNTMLGMVWNPTKGLYLAPNAVSYTHLTLPTKA